MLVSAAVIYMHAEAFLR